MFVEMKLDQVEAVEDQLAGVAVLPELAVLEELDAQIMRVDLRLDVGPERREGVEGLAARELALRSSGSCGRVMSCAAV
jgi:hypothetical protein